MPNQYVNKVEYGNNVIIDITDTTAEAADVIEGSVFYAKSGQRSVGTLTDATITTHGLMSTTDKVALEVLKSLGLEVDNQGYIIQTITEEVSGNAGSE